MISATLAAGGAGAVSWVEPRDAAARQITVATAMASAGCLIFAIPVAGAKSLCDVIYTTLPSAEKQERVGCCRFRRSAVCFRCDADHRRFLRSPGMMSASKARQSVSPRPGEPAMLHRMIRFSRTPEFALSLSFLGILAVYVAAASASAFA